MIFEAFPLSIKNDVATVMNVIPKTTHNNISTWCSENYFEYNLEGIYVKIPYRIYCVDILNDVYEALNTQQRLIINCIYTRHYDGFIREKHLKSLLSCDFPDWVIPFILKLCDEYVVQIVDTLYAHLKTKNNIKIKEFCLNNSTSLSKSYDRMISYWNCYYRYKYKYLNEYVGYKLFRECFNVVTRTHKDLPAQHPEH